MTLDLSRAFQQGFRGGSTAEYLAVASLVRTIGANLPEVKRVLLVCGGAPLRDARAGICRSTGRIEVADCPEVDRMPATHDPRPIGVFDSGLGGLTVGARAVPHAAAASRWSTSATPRACPTAASRARR